VPHKYFVVDGVATYLHHTGATTLPETPPDLSQGEVVLCLHGTGRHGGDFQPLLGALADAHSPLAFDQPGHGRSGTLDSLGAIDRMRDFTRTLTGRLGLRPHVLLGHSLGAAVALDYSLDHSPEEASSVRGLILLSAGARFSFSDEFLDNSRLVTEGKRRREFDPTAFAKGASPDVMRRAFMGGMKTDPRATHGDLLALADWQREEALAGIAAPTLVLHGDAERPDVASSADRLVELLPNARKAVVADAGQMLLFEQPDAVAGEVRDFLKELA
jgi:pimeloyl-ACP methyl ester carboxylesterase